MTEHLTETGDMSQITESSYDGWVTRWLSDYFEYPYTYQVMIEFDKEKCKWQIVNSLKR